jgi:hypothetical protein
MSLVLGGSTPIHLPKIEQQRASVFRGRPEGEGDSPPKMLLSLRTPTTSFDEAKPPAKKESPKPPPEDPLLEKSPKQGLIDMNPSFVLFNQSFDSFGDANYFNESLQADSFGMEHSDLKKTGQQLLTAGSLTIGFSPVNSFGNHAPPRREMVLDGRSPSPTQVLYSLSGGMRPEEEHASFGGPHRSFGETYYDNGEPSFYILLRKYKMAFKDCSFLLPGLKAALLEPPSDSNKMESKWESVSHSNVLTKRIASDHKTYCSSLTEQTMYGGPAGRYADPTPQDIVIARRRVESSICAFGGQVIRDNGPTSVSSNKDSIFRSKDEGEPVTVTPSSSVTSPTQKSQERLKYEEALSGRYYENDNRLSWEFEEDPPVEISAHVEVTKEETSRSNTFDDEGKPLADSGMGDNMEATDEFCQPANNPDSDMASTGTSQPKMRYRCKLCGQPKQNHRCTYQQSLARSIGVMVYPVVNSFISTEPGVIAAPLSEMNNFVDLKDSISGEEPSPARPASLGVGVPAGPSAQVTPESLRSNALHSPVSFNTPSRFGSRNKRSGKKRLYSQANADGENPDDLLFMEPMELRPEQFRTISHSKARESKGAYTYPALPLPYAQRKRLSDNLFSLSNDVPKLTDECAQVLREARERDAWDVAVAELMTQVIVIAHCPDGDHRFEGLRQYLLTLGIAC